MRSFLLSFVSLSACCCAGFAQTAALPDPYQKEALVWEHYDTAVHMRADGTGERTMHVVARLQSEGAVRQFGIISVSFASAYETGSIDFLRVHKPNGTIVETPVADAIEMPSPVTQTAPLYSDLKEKQLPVRSLAAGDVIEYQLRTVRTKAEAPGQFWGAEHFLRDAGVVLSQTLTVEAPSNIYLQVWSPNHPAKPKQHDGLNTYSWSVSQLQATDKSNRSPALPEKVNDPDEDADGRKLPSVAWTTFHSWPELGSWYRSLALSRSEPTPAIVRRANELTKDARTPDEVVRALYDFVSHQIRYVGIDFGIGRIQPHAAEEVMTYQYGDCKDKDTLFEALLRAKGLTAAPALIGVGIAPVPDLPSPALFNHVITTVALPTRQVWLDTTPGAAPYQVLFPLIRDQQALVIPAAAAARLERTPALPPYPYFERFEAVGTLGNDGLLTSHMDMTLRSDNELGFRSLVQQVAPAQWDEALQSVSRALGFGGTVSHADLRQKDPAAPVHLSYDYTRPQFADWDHHRILPLFPALDIAYIDQDKAPEHDIDQGAPRKLEAMTRIQVPQGWNATFPDAIHVNRKYATFDQTYRMEKDTVIIERTTVILQQKVPKAEWKDYYAYTKAIGAQTGENYIALNQPGESGSSAALEQARTEMMQGNWDAARQTLNDVKAKDPSAPYLMTMLGYLAQHDKKPEEAVRDFETELATHPDANVSLIVELASYYAAQKRYSEAEALLRRFLSRNDVKLFKALSDIQVRAGDDAGAVATLQSASVALPQDHSMNGSLSYLWHRLHRDDEAFAIVQKTIATSEDAEDLNSSAYLLAEMKRDLPLAETTSRRAIEKLEASLTGVTAQQATDKEFGQTNLLVATWDTLGWILFEQQRPADAEPYLRAAWFSQAGIVVGDHLAQTLEALGKPAEALSIDELALAAGDGSQNALEQSEVKANAERLRSRGKKAGVRDATQSLQQMRTFHITKTGGVVGSGTFAIAIEDDRVYNNALVEGPRDLRALGQKIDQLKMPGALPKGSKARLFREGILFCSASASTCEFVLAPHKFHRAPQ